MKKTLSQQREDILDMCNNNSKKEFIRVGVTRPRKKLVFISDDETKKSQVGLNNKNLTERRAAVVNDLEERVKRNKEMGRLSNKVAEETIEELAKVKKNTVEFASKVANWDTFDGITDIFIQLCLNAKIVTYTIAGASVLGVATVLCVKNGHSLHDVSQLYQLAKSFSPKTGDAPLTFTNTLQTTKGIIVSTGDTLAKLKDLSDSVAETSKVATRSTLEILKAISNLVLVTYASSSARDLLRFVIRYTPK